MKAVLERRFTDLTEVLREPGIEVWTAWDRIYLAVLQKDVLVLKHGFGGWQLASTCCWSSVGSEEGYIVWCDHCGVDLAGWTMEDEPALYFHVDLEAASTMDWLRADITYILERNLELEHIVLLRPIVDAILASAMAVSILDKEARSRFDLEGNKPADAVSEQRRAHAAEWLATALPTLLEKLP